ncbi:MAG: hypothetical protein GX050_02830 [Firmicutes bacterium]|nr:hypothetical protein [Bacillota bacterium]
MLKKITQFIIFILLSLCVTCPAFANSDNDDYDGTLLGLKFGIETVSKTSDISGGSYLYLNPLVSFNQRFSINFRYSVEIAPNSFSDHLFSITPQFNFKYNNQDDQQYYFGLSCLITRDNTYYGFKYSPLCMGRFSSHKSTSMIDMLPISYLYSPKTSEHVLIIEVTGLGFFF